MTIQEYIDSVTKRFASGITTEHSFRGDLQTLIESLVPEVMATNEPRRIDCGAPDYVLTRKAVPIGYIEAKDIGTDLTGKTFKEQYDRYREALDNLAFTDYLEFRFFAGGEPQGTPLSIAEIQGSRVVPLTQNFDAFATRIREFCARTTQTMKGSQRLAEMMADKAKILAFTIRTALESDEKTEENTTLREQMAAFKQILIHDIDAKQFADVYAQTIAYGMFAARLHDKNLDTFSRREAAELIPKTNPFLRSLFQHIAGYDLDTRIDWIVDDLADLFRATDIRAVLKNYGKTRASQDPIMHFYETFLAEYDPKLRKARGVYYTPEPVVDFIVRAVDDILKTEFKLPAGLADTSKVKVKVKVPIVKKNKGTVYEEVEQEFHKVQILDPATGTGTFLATVIKQIHKKFKNQQGAWPTYVENDLIPRLNGFELLMASYAMAHLKLDLLLDDTGYKDEPSKRFQIYLTNALEEFHPDTGTLWASWLSAEANEANHIKRDAPVMVVIGNPPYSGESSNKGDWIMSLMEDYKKEPGGKEKLDEKNSKFVNDDYVKFLRFGQYIIEKNDDGVLAFINNHGFLDNPTFRGMRWHLLKAFDEIFVIDLHGNSIRKERSPDGSEDKNVFDIKPGVSINICVRRKDKRTDLATVNHAEVYGGRGTKYQYLIENSLSTIKFAELTNKAPDYLFVPRDRGILDEYEQGFDVDKIMPENSLGILTKRDKLSTGLSAGDVRDKVEYFLDSNRSITEVCAHFGLSETDKDRWNAVTTRQEVDRARISEFIKSCQYRPFDARAVFYEEHFVARMNPRVLRHFNLENVGLVVGRQGQAVGGNSWNVIFSTNSITEQNIFRRGGGTVFPLYLYGDSTQPTLDGRPKRVPNLDFEIVEKIAKLVDLEFVPEENHPDANASLLLRKEGVFAPIDLFDYIYAVLHSPTYRERYKEFLKIDFPRVPYPTDKEKFWRLVELGGELRQLHLLESAKVNEFITGFPIAGSYEVHKPVFKPHGLGQGGSSLGDVFINLTQYFSNVPRVAWEFYIGGYQPAQKWLKDRKGRKLSSDDIKHYQKIIVALTETDRLMKEIDKIGLFD